MRKILFVCSGNTCRSPMAEGYFNLLSLRGTNNDWEASSAGLHTVEGLPIQPQSKENLATDGIDLSKHNTRPVTSDIVNESELIYTMTNEHKRELLERFPTARGKVFSIAEATSLKHDIADPIGLGPEVYNHVYKEIKRAVKEIYQDLMA